MHDFLNGIQEVVGLISPFTPSISEAYEVFFVSLFCGLNLVTTLSEAILSRKLLESCQCICDSI